MPASHGPLVYAPGSYALVCSPISLALIDLPVVDPILARISELVAADAELDDLLDVLISVGVRAAPSFGMAQWDDAGCRVLARGGIRVSVEGEAVDATGAPWIDRFFPGSPTVKVGEAADGPWLAIESGMALAAAVGHFTSQEKPSAEVEPEALPARAVTPPEPEPVLDSARKPGRALEPEPEPVLGSDLVFGRAPEPVPGDKPGRALELEPESEPGPEPPTQPLTPKPIIGAAAVKQPPPPSGLLIESFPWASGSESAPTAAPTASRPESPTPEPPAVPFAAAPSWSGLPPADSDPEASELTIDRRNLVGRAGPSDTMVWAARCSGGHLTPTHTDKCRVCGQAVPPQEPFEAARPSLGVLRLSNGDLVALDRPVIMGRNPHLPSGYSGEQPNLLKLSDPGKDVSSQHLEVSLDYWHVLVTDLGSTNGTEVVLPGQVPVQLIPNDPMTIEPGTRVILAGVMEFVFEVR